MPIPAPESLVVALSASDVSLVVDLSGGALPRVVHWGERLDHVDVVDLTALVGAQTSLPGPNLTDVPPRVAVLPEHHTGWTGRPGLTGSRDGRGWSTRFTVDRVELDGSPVESSRVDGPGLLTVRATDAHAGLALVIELGLDATGLVRARATLTNTADGTFAVDGLALALPVPSGHDEILDFTGRWGGERAPQRLPFRIGAHVRENRRGRTGADSAYLLHVGTPGFGFERGSVRAVHAAWSGNHVHYAEHAFTGDRLIGAGELLLSGEVRLEAGDAYSSPWLFFAAGDGLDAVARRFHAHLRSRPRPVSPDRPVTLNVWEAVYFDHSLDRLVELAERAARVGVERYVLDDGWFGGRRHDVAGLGDWVVSPEAWPDGLHPLVDRVHGLGMEFGLWFEPEMVNLDSDVARAHPDWVMAARDDLPVPSRHQQVLDLTAPGAYEHVKGQILAILDEYDIGYLKWDHNRDLVEAGSQVRGGRPAVHEQTLALYRLLDEIRAAHPGLEIESCSSGGGRVDLGVLERTDRVWVSDVIDPLERQHMLRWTTQLIPPEYMGSHIASQHSHSTGRSHSLSFRAGTAIFGHLGIEWDLTTVDDATLDEIAEWVAFYKAHRDLLLACDLVRVDTGVDDLFVHGVVRPDRSEAIFAIATVGALLELPGPAVRLPGLQPDRRYRVRPVVVGTPAGVVAPPWWGDDVGAPDRATAPSPPAPPRWVNRGAEFAGVVLPGSVLATVGVSPPLMQPDTVVLLHVGAC
ncbi:alpha-galactosidase [Nostocoides sp. F2B08]|uniref:alpha-galactosidase n=1 Tax=Nostocoides sp. F2B08 TaxID=2653936 RepID=UPI001263BC5F|nr:alpha-galactosidase [Tetrasphaera sp. F2B08]KAB7743807.1 alpha-galactosidase [Tetrasphaera sp. F2B08]